SVVYLSSPSPVACCSACMISSAAALSSNKALTMLSRHRPGGGSPGSPKMGCSSGVSACASSMLADNAPSSISVSLMSSALLSCASTLSESQATDRPSLSLRPLSFDVDAEFLLQIVDADAALVEGGISEQIAMQRH